ncbi:hypothetical protein P152DRAFT_153304 [Eremomyces bilateralis CBS 781.70]|uniref:Uncharacterized protein n=1 Tax=Eremomyces bilateralis CBS 781.70 TaxID=1392243 RepID=A0A6G1FUX2_9PEZI|nr:uncharacterized protein P152DRAFT_153304 [Eremomyces bilateralis CBS 781.70]KAF1809584.1 hypothetical protein P152DRAFT_153304 [Eremomyces bilateralis CBS 781.70]
MVNRRFSYHQNLFLIACLLERNSFLFQTGDQRSFNDVLRRKAADWEPKIGNDTLAWKKRDQKNNTTWEKIALALTGGNYGFRTISLKDLRMQLAFILLEIQRISTDFDIRIERRERTQNLDAQETLLLLGVSLGIRPLRLDPPNFWSFKGLDELAKLLAQSPVFLDGISACDLEQAITSLELLFRTLDSQSHEAGLNVPMSLGKRRSDSDLHRISKKLREDTGI